jgi:hypothetical protein
MDKYRFEETRALLEAILIEEHDDFRAYCWENQIDPDDEDIAKGTNHRYSEVLRALDELWDVDYILDGLKNGVLMP